ncbi:hypothetical protein YC2023_090874 [Brassica napus]
MGSGITQFASTNGLDVWLMDADGNALSRATTAISSSSREDLAANKREMENRAVPCAFRGDNMVSLK